MLGKVFGRITKNLDIGHKILYVLSLALRVCLAFFSFFFFFGPNFGSFHVAPKLTKLKARKTVIQ